jgi:O-antigen ligase
MTLAHQYGVLACLFLGVVLVLPRNRQNQVLLNWAWAAGALGALTLFLTFTRGVWLSMFMAAFFMIFMVRKKMALIFVAASGFGVGLLFLVWEGFRNRLLYAFDPQGYDQNRLNLWRANWEIFKDNPWFGVGWGQNKALLMEYYAKLGITDERFMMVSHAHNQTLHLLAGTGILGFLGFVAFNVVFFVMSWRLWKLIPLSEAWHRALVLAAMGAQVHFWFGGLFESNFEHSKMRYAMSFAWGVILWLYHDYMSSKKATLKSPLRKMPIQQCFCLGDREGVDSHRNPIDRSVRIDVIGGRSAIHFK